MIYSPQLGKNIDLLRSRGYEDLLSKRLIFTITTGRSGTQTISEVFSCGKDSCSMHEPVPAYSKCLRRAQRNADVALEFLLEEKIPAILAADAPCYVETSHLICKGFIEPILELGLRPHFLFIERDCRAVAKSFLLINSIPERTPLGCNYMLSPADPCLLQMPFWEDFTDYQLCYWYTLEMRRRSRWYAALFDRLGISYTRFEFANINKPEKYIELLATCGLAPVADTDERINQILEHPINTKAGDKISAGKQAEVADPNILDHAERMVARACKANIMDDYVSRVACVQFKAA